MAELNFLDDMIAHDNHISPAVLAERLRISRIELASALGLSRDAVSKSGRAGAPKTQSRMRDMIEIINRILPWAGSELAAFAWYRSQSLPSFGDKTAEELVSEGKAEAVKTYLGRIAEGGYA